MVYFVPLEYFAMSVAIVVNVIFTIAPSFLQSRFWKNRFVSIIIHYLTRYSFLRPIA